MTKRERNARDRAFLFRGGIRIADTVIACDGPSGGDLLFVSNARALDDKRAARGGRGFGSRTQLLTTNETLSLAGTQGERLRARSLIVTTGRPFSLGSLRLELLPSGHLPGGAVLSCETGTRRLLYAGAARLGSPVWGAAAGAVRTADALCIDATFGHPRFAFLGRDEAMAAACDFASAARDARHAAVFLAGAWGPAQDLAAALARAGWKPRGHRSIIAATSAYRRAGVELPNITRFAGKLAHDEVLLWPVAERAAGRLGQLGAVRVAWVSGWAADRAATERINADVALPYSSHADFAGLIAYALASGAPEIAVFSGQGFAEEFARALRERDRDAYVLGPPRQIPLFGGD